MPKRIQRKRVKGWRAPEGAINCTRPGRYGNPYKIGDRYRSPFDESGVFTVTGANCISLFETYVKGRLAMEPEWLEPLRGHDLMCWCALTSKCHVDTLLRLANGH